MGAYSRWTLIRGWANNNGQINTVNTHELAQARENASGQVAIGFSFAFDWLRGWREFSGPIAERSKAKPMQTRITFDTQLTIVLTQSYL